MKAKERLHLGRPARVAPNTALSAWQAGERVAGSGAGGSLDSLLALGGNRSSAPRAGRRAHFGLGCFPSCLAVVGVLVGGLDGDNGGGARGSNDDGGRDHGDGLIFCVWWR